jgi:hypothetical protein
MYIQTGDVAWARHAHRASRYYVSKIALDSTSHTPYARGAWMGKAPSWSGDTGDVKYSHAGGLFTDYLLTGDARLLDPISAVADFAMATVSFRLFPYAQTSGLWTERHLAAGLGNIMYAYEVGGDATRKSQLQTIITGMQTDVTTPPSGYPADMRGVLLHRPEVHEGDSYSDTIMSPWLSGLLCDVLMHYYLISSDNRALNFMSNYAQFVADRGIYNDIYETNSVYVPWYIVGVNGAYTDSGVYDDIQHTPDILGLLARGRWARTQLGLSTTTIDTQITRLRTSANFAFADAVRTTAGLPRYRSAPARRAGWWFGTNESLNWFGQY